MAKQAEKKEYPYPSRYGSHVSMVVKEESDKLHHDFYCVCKDERGMYITKKENLDSRLADPFRCDDVEARNNLLKEITGQVFEIILDE